MFADTTLDALFSHILDNDVVVLSAELPAAVPQHFTADEIGNARRLAYELFVRRADVDGLRRLAAGAIRRGDVAADARLPFKHVRALFKQLRFASANFDRRHRYPRLLDLITIELGHFQDDYKNGRRAKTRLQAVLVRAMLSRGAVALLRRELRDFQPASPDDLARWIAAENRRLRETLARPAVTGRQFHALRKIVSRRVSLYDTLRAAAPAEPLARTAQFLATLNGLMGGFHDRLIEQRVSGTHDYARDLFAMPAEIRDRLAAFVARTACG